MIEPYPFHCTPCGFSHAGECEEKFNAPPPGMFPATGTFWTKQILTPSAGGKWSNALTWEVLDFDAAFSDKVKMRGGMGGDTEWFSIEAWSKEGVVAKNPSCRMRFFGPLEMTKLKP